MHERPTQERTTGPGPGRPGDFERYGLLAAVTLVVVTLLLADRMRPSQGRPDLPGEDQIVRLTIGGRPELGRAPLAPDPGAPAAVDPPSAAPPRREPSPQAGARRPPEEERSPPPPPAEPRVRVVRPGETLSAIAREELGSSRRAAEIATLNGIEDPDSIRAGQSLRLPPR